MSVVQEIVGHKNPAMTRHYTHTGIEGAQKAIDALPMGTHHSSLVLGDTRSQINIIMDSATPEQLQAIYHYVNKIV